METTIKVLYNGKNITADISESLLSLVYTDKTEGECDELELNLEDAARLWQFDWYPEPGAKITASITDSNGKVLECGSFTLDEITQTGSREGDFITFKCIAAGIGQKTRTRNNSVHTQKTLREIANTIAAKHGLTVQGNISNISIGYETQHKETDLHFLQRIAVEYGHVFSLRDNKIIFSSVFDLEGRGASLVIDRNELLSYEITDKTAETYKGGRVRYHHPGQRRVVQFLSSAGDPVNQHAKPDTLELHSRVENEGQAELKSKAALHRKNSHQQGGSFSMPGNVLAVAGNNAEFTGLGRLSGLYHLFSTTHNVSKDAGYTTEGQIKRVGLISSSKQQPK